MTKRSDRPRADRRRAVTVRLGGRTATAACAARSPRPCCGSRHLASIYEFHDRYCTDARKAREQLFRYATAATPDTTQTPIACAGRHGVMTWVGKLAVSATNSAMRQSASNWSPLQLVPGMQLLTQIDRSECAVPLASGPVNAGTPSEPVCSKSIAVEPADDDTHAVPFVGRFDLRTCTITLRPANETATARRLALDRCEVRLFRHETRAAHRTSIDRVAVGPNNGRGRSYRRIVIVVHHARTDGLETSPSHQKQRERWGSKICRMGPVVRTSETGIPRFACHTRTGRR